MSIADIWLAFTLFLIGTGLSIYALIQIRAYIKLALRNGKKKQTSET